MKKKLCIIAVAAMFLISVTANAVAPIILGAGIELLTAGGTEIATLAAASSGGVSAVWTGVVTSIGAAVGYAAIKGATGNAAVRIPVSGTSQSLPPVPPPSGTSTANPNYTQSGTGLSVPTAEMACQGNPAGYPGCPNFCATFDHAVVNAGGTASCYFRDSSGGVSAQLQVFTNGTFTCPVGYAPVSGVCQMVDFRQAVADGNCDVQRSGNTYSYYSGDKDCDVNGAIKGAITTGGAAMTVAGVDSFNNPVSTTVTPNADGSTTFSQTVQTQDSQGNTTITTKNLTINSNGSPSTVNQITQPGAMTINTTNQTATTTTAPGGAVSAPTINFPNDYAKEPTQQENKSLLTSIDKSLKDTDKDPPKDVTPSQRANAEPYFTNAFSGLKAWSFPSHTSTCPVIRFHVSYFTDDIVIDGHCAIVANNAAMISTVMLLLFGLMAMFIVLAA